MELHCEWALSELNLSQRNKFLAEKHISSSAKFLPVHPMDLYSIYYVEDGLNISLIKKLLYLEMTLIIKSFQSPSEKSRMRIRRERGIIACVPFVTTEVLCSFQ